MEGQFPVSEQNTKVVHCKKGEPFDVYIGRPSIFGNPFSHRRSDHALVMVKSRKEAIDMYRKWINGEVDVKGAIPPTIDQIKSLKGKTLGCWCKPRACHGDVLAEICDD